MEINGHFFGKQKTTLLRGHFKPHGVIFFLFLFKEKNGITSLVIFTSIVIIAFLFPTITLLITLNKIQFFEYYGKIHFFIAHAKPLHGSRSVVETTSFMRLISNW